LINGLYLKASHKALSAYCAFQRLILHLVEQSPTLLEWANQHVDKFIRDPRYCTKRVRAHYALLCSALCHLFHEAEWEPALRQNVPDLGKFLPLLSVTENSWDNIKLAYLKENFDRALSLCSSLCFHDQPSSLGHVRWVLQKHPELACKTDNPSNYAEGWFSASTVSRATAICIILDLAS